MIILALTKGRIEESAIKLLQKAGYSCPELDDKGRKLMFYTTGGDLCIILAKAADVITYVEHGVCDAGIVGEDTIMENAKSVYEVLDLKFGKCRFALAGKKGESFDSSYAHKVIASKYPNVTKNYFNSKNTDVEVVKIEGSVELAPLLGLADAIVDIVETGSTLKENGLEVYETIAEISTRLIINRASVKMKRLEMNEFINRLEEAVN
jgi:ATP phosphoribosyltransferase